jgi:hypothetical protein
VNANKLKEILLPLPPFLEQHRLVSKIEALFSDLDKAINSLKTAREQFNIYRQALLKHAFSGKLTEKWRAENQDKLEIAKALLQRIQTERERGEDLSGERVCPFTGTYFSTSEINESDEPARAAKDPEYWSKFSVGQVRASRKRQFRRTFLKDSKPTTGSTVADVESGLSCRLATAIKAGANAIVAFNLKISPVMLYQNMALKRYKHQGWIGQDTVLKLALQSQRQCCQTYEALSGHQKTTGGNACSPNQYRPSGAVNKAQPTKSRKTIWKLIGREIMIVNFKEHRKTQECF